MLLGLRFEIAGPPVVAGVVSQETEVIDSERRLFTMAVFIIVVSAGPPRPPPKLPAAGKNYENSTLNLLVPPGRREFRQIP